MSGELNELKCREEDWDFRILSNRLLMKRTDRPDEWSMDSLASMALALEARVKELESEDWCRTALKYQARIKELEGTGK
jgi:hypothetical protein